MRSARLRKRLTVNLTLEPARDFRGLEDRIESTVDYFAVTRAVHSLASSRERRLIETLAEEVLARFAMRAVEVELRKYILPDTAFVAVRCRRVR